MMNTLFLDRDGVLNSRIPGNYIKTPDEFQPMEGLGEAMRILSNHFDRIIVVTNQAGIGKGLMTETALHSVHLKLLQIVEAAGGRIDRIYHCPHRTEVGCTCRKPATGMAWKALADFPDLDFENAWMVGDSASDMEFAQRLGFRPVLIRGKYEELEALASLRIGLHFDTLLDFARWYAED